LQENDLGDSVETTSDGHNEAQDVQIENIPVAEMAVDYSPKLNTAEVGDVAEDKLPEMTEDQDTEASDDAPEIISGESASEPVIGEFVQTEIEMSVPESTVAEEPEISTDNHEIGEQHRETEKRMNEDLVSEEEEEILDETTVELTETDDVMDAPVVELEPIVEEVEEPTHDITAEEPPEATLSAVPPYIAPIEDEVRESIEPPGKSKSRWQQFKEKVQGFLKKVFG
jgi:hypothetical protein